MQRAMYFQKIEDSKVQCFLCPHNCVIMPGQKGVCRVRQNIGGELYSLNYGKIASIALDPIEKKPLKRFRPSSNILSAGTFGCNLKCSFCQNWSIAHQDAQAYDVTPELLVAKAMEVKKQGNIGIAYTYNEPSIWYEYVFDTARLAKAAGLVNVIVTNGFLSEQPMKDLLPYVDAMNIDVKGFTAGFYNRVCKATLENVKRTVELAASGCHVEITTLVIPGLNDSEKEMGELACWLASISPEIPLHLSRFFPNYLMNDRPVTPVETLRRCRDIASEYLDYVYLGNIMEDEK